MSTLKMDMEKLKKIGRYSKRLILRSKRDQEVQVEEADFSFRTNVHEETLTVSWSIENPQKISQKKGEYLESPTFLTGFSSEVGWNLRIYPRGRRVDGYVGLFIHKNTAGPVTSLKYEMANEFICSPENIQVMTKRAIFMSSLQSSHKEYIKPTSEGSSDYGTDKFMESGLLHYMKSILITCHITITHIENEEVVTNVMEHTKSTALFKDFRELLKTGKLSDVTLQVGDKQFPVHKAILASRSEVFKTMLSHEMKEKQTGIIQIDDVKPSIMESLLQYIYTGKIDDFDSERAIALYPVADKYYLDELKKWCVGAMLSNLNVKNVCQVAVLADLYAEAKLKTAVNATFRKYKLEILNTKEWKNIIQQKHQLATDILQTLSLDFFTTV